MDENNVRANEVEEIETAGFIGGVLAYAAISGAKKLRTIFEEKWAAKKLAEAAKPVEAAMPEPEEAPQEPDEDETDE